MLHDLSDLFDSEALPTAPTDTVFPLDQNGVDEAFARMKGRRAVGKVVLVPGGGSGTESGGEAKHTEADDVKKEL